MGKQFHTVVTRKGQITIPAEIRKSLGINEGDRIALVMGDDQQVRLAKSDSVVARTAGMLKSGAASLRAEALLALLELTGVILPGKRYLPRVFDLYVSLNLPFADAYHAVLAERFSNHEVASFDKHFDRIPGIKRVEPL